MNVVSSPRIQRGLKRIHTFLIGGIVCFIIAIGFLGWFLVDSNNAKNAISLNDLIVDGVTESTYAEVEIASVPYAFAEYEGISERYYFVFDSKDYMYVVYLSEDQFQQFDHDDIADNPVVIKGMTGVIKDDIKKIAMDEYNDANGEEILTDENFDRLVGSIYLDATITEEADDFQLLFVFIFGGISIVLFTFLIINKKNTKKAINQFSESEWRQVEEEIESDTTIAYDSLRLYFTENYVVILDSGVDIFRYQDIIWMYPHILKQYGITTNKNIILVTKDKRHHTVANVSNFSKKSKEAYNDIMTYLHDKNPSCIVGYTKENIQVMKEQYGIKS